ncbi:MAG: T9SS type A sorting domain-containing protein, partial [Flavitalea sp.]
GAGAGYDEISDRIMHRIQYRNFGTHESIVLNHTVNANYPLGNPKAGIRWYELRRTNSDWTVYQQSTFSPDEDGRFMGAININSTGQIAIAYNHSGPGKYASIYFTGRNADDPLNQMIYSETLLKEGTEFGTQGSRWGDYSDLTLDPVNDSIFWFSGMYGGTNWQTRISAFKFQSIPKVDAQIVSIITPVKDLTQCEREISPAIIIQSNGSLLLNTARIIANVDGQTKIDYEWTGNLRLSGKDTIQLPSFLSDTGSHEMEILIEVMNEDGNLNNNTLKQNFTILGASENAIREDFEQDLFPPAQWSLYNYQPSTQGFRRSTEAGNRSNASAVMKNFSNPVIGDIDVLAAPIVKTEEIDSLILSFDLAYKLYGQSASFADTLQVVISTDCGKTFQPVWERASTGLATVKGNITSEYIPATADWKRIRLDLKPFIGNALEVMAGFRSKGKFGQNIYIDNVSFDRIILPERRIMISKIISPSSPVCSTSIQPVIEFSNRGKEPVTEFTIYYKLNNGNPDSLFVTGNFQPGRDTIISSFRQLNIPAGQISKLQVYTNEDTVNIELTQPLIVKDELKEGFENVLFPPQHWSERTRNYPYNWERTNWSSATGNASALIRNFMSNSGGKKDQLVSPVIQLTNYDSVYLSFDLAYPANEDATDTLELKITQPCQEDGISIFKKWGKDLSTSANAIPFFSNRDTSGFIPDLDEWENKLINITSAVKSNEFFQLIFENSADKGHNLYIDNIRVYTVILPRKLKENGYIVFPNPTSGQVIIRHLEDPLDLKQVEVINSLGQVLLKLNYSGNAGRNLQLDLSRMTSGLYNIRMTYTGKVISERIIKTK